jgi:hypothetical protein
MAIRLDMWFLVVMVDPIVDDCAYWGFTRVFELLRTVVMVVSLAGIAWSSTRV